jgi:hypothetical protein
MRGSKSTVANSASTKPDTKKLTLRAYAGFNGNQFVIQNKDSFDWTNVTMTVYPGSLYGDSYELHIELLKVGEQYRVGAMQFTNDEGLRFNAFTHKPREFYISSREGDVSLHWD